MRSGDEMTEPFAVSGCFASRAQKLSAEPLLLSQNSSKEIIKPTDQGSCDALKKSLSSSNLGWNDALPPRPALKRFNTGDTLLDLNTPEYVSRRTSVSSIDTLVDISSVSRPEEMKQVEADIKASEGKLAVEKKRLLVFEAELAEKEALKDNFEKFICKFNNVIKNRSEQISYFLEKINSIDERYIAKLNKLEGMRRDLPAESRKFKFLNFFRFLGIFKIFNIEDKNLILKNKIKELAAEIDRDRSSYAELTKIWLSIEKNNQLSFSRSSMEGIRSFSSQALFDEESKKIESSLAMLNKKQSFVFDSLLSSLKQYGLDKVFGEIRQKAEDINKNFEGNVRQKYIEFEKSVFEKKFALVLAERQNLSEKIEQRKVEMKQLEEELDKKRELLKLSDELDQFLFLKTQN